ncbi:MAG: potassium-transporting ATPase subunit KdpA [Ignavibacteriales bacterium]|nr:potassium-transporting ATPase subunit KdpA [Ignavibacteriales bacterium]
MITTHEIIQLIFYIVVLTALAPLLGGFFAKVLKGEKSFLTPVFGKVESFIYKFSRINPSEEMDWKVYTFALMAFNLFGILFLIVIQLIQSYLPLNPQGLPNVELTLAINTAVSFVTNTNWQSYGGETTLGYFVQMIGLAVQNFVSAATAIAVLLVLIRALKTRKGNTLGNFWVDLTRSTIYILLPLAIIWALVLVSQGVVQTFSSYKEVTMLEGAKQVIPLGPAASQIAIKMLGTNGGGFFNTNSAFPFENPTPFSNFIQVLGILLISASLVFTFGRMIGSKKHAWVIYGVMLFLFVAGLSVSIYSEYSTNPIFHTSGLMEGKESRFGVANSVLWSTATTSASNGSVNAMHSSLSPLAGMITLFNMEIGEIIFGGVGCGLYGILLFVFLTVFIAGLMIGRTPEYLGKKIESREVKWSIVAILLPSAVILLFSAIAMKTTAGLSSLANAGPHGYSEILYAFSSAAGNNGSAFAGLNANTTFYNLMMALGMFIGRFGVLIPVMIISGSLVKKNITPASSGTLSTENFLFGLLLVGVILIVGALTFFPALSFGPIIEHLLMGQGITF